MPKEFWKYMPEPTYNTWQANKFKQQAMDEIEKTEQEKVAEQQQKIEDLFKLQDNGTGQPPADPMMDPGMAPAEPAGNPLLDMLNQPQQQMNPAGGSVVEGMIGGGLIKSAFRKGADLFDAIHNSPLGDAVGRARDVYDYTQDNVVHPASGLLGAISQNNVLNLLNPIAASTDLGQRIGGGTGHGSDITSLGWGDGGLNVQHSNGSPSTSLSANRQNMNGFNRFAFDTIADPLTYVGSYGKAAEGLPLIGRAAPAISKIENVPVKGMEALIGGAGKAISYPLAHTPIGDLTRETTGSIARREGEAMANAARRAIDSTAGHLGGYASKDTAAVDALRVHLNSTPNHLLSPEEMMVKNLLSKTGKGSAIGDILHTAATTPEQFTQAAAGVAHQNERKAIDAAIQAQRATQGLKGKILNKADDVYQGVWEGKNAGIWPGVGPIQRAASGAILNTMGFPVGNAMETAVESALGGGGIGRMTAEEAARRASAARDIPQSIFTNDNDPLIVQALRQGPAKPRGTLGKIVNAPTELSGKLTEPMRRNFWVTQYEKLTASGLSADEAAAKATDLMEKSFPGGSQTESVVDAVAKHVFPYWNYEKSRIPFLGRAAARHPGTIPAYQEYMDNTDKGSIQLPDVPGTSIGDFSFNPTRGTSLGLIQSMQRPDFPTYTTGKSGVVEQITNALGSKGFYPGTAINAGIAAGRILEGQPPELGSLIPGTTMVPLQAAEAARGIPGLGHIGDAAANINNVVGNTRFRENAISKQLAMMGVEPDKATPAERKTAESLVALDQITTTETNFLGWKPRAEKEYKDARIQAAIDNGVPEDIARSSATSGNPLKATKPGTNEPYIDSAKLREIYNKNPDWERWRQASEPLQRPADREINAVTDEYNKAIDDVETRRQMQLAELYTRLHEKSGQMSGDLYRQQRSAIEADAIASRRAVEEVYKKRGALTTPEARDAFYQSQGREIIGKTPEDVAAQKYYDIQPEQFADPDTTKIDFKAYNTARQQYLDSLDPKTKNYIVNEYPQKKTANVPVNPNFLQEEQHYKDTMNSAQEFFDMPKYIGLSRKMQDAISRASLIVQTLRTQNPWMDNETATAFAMMKEPLGAALLPVASDLINPARKRYLSKHPEVAWLFSKAPRSMWEDPLIGDDNSL